MPTAGHQDKGEMTPFIIVYIPFGKITKTGSWNFALDEVQIKPPFRLQFNWADLKFKNKNVSKV